MKTEDVMKILGYVIVVSIFFQCQHKQQDQNKSKDNHAEPVRVGPENYNSSLSYYGTTPESPDGKLIAFTVFLKETVNERSEKVPAEIWVCNSDLTDYRKVLSINPLATHNAARIQWLDNHSFLYEDDSIRVIDLEGKPLIEAVVGRSGHETHDGKFLYAANHPETRLSSIYEYDVAAREKSILADVNDFSGLLDHYTDTAFTPVSQWRILHLQYNIDASKLSFRLDVGPRNEHYRHLVTMNYDGTDVQYFGPKPMHFLWFDEETVMGHDNQIEDGQANDKSLRRWSLNREYLETLAGTGNHTGAAPNRKYFASESWYGENPIVVRVFKKNNVVPIWTDTASTDPHTTWTLAYHTNPSFSRDSKRVYYNKCVAPGKVRVYMAVLPEN